MKNRIFFLLLSTLLACQSQSESKEWLSGIPYTYHQFGEGDFPQSGETISAFLLVQNEAGDTLHYVPDYTYFLPLGAHRLDSAFLKMIPGDSLSLFCSNRLLNEYFNFYQLNHLVDSMKSVLNIRLLRSYPQETAEMAQKKNLSEREVKEQEALIRYLEMEKDSLEFFRGIYRRIENKTAGVPLAFGDEISIHYRGSFLNRYVFDDTRKKGTAPSFTYGKEEQVIDGIHYGLIGMKEGESVKIIVPSRRAFGEVGSVAGIVPPYTSVVFDIQLIKVSKKQ